MGYASYNGISLGPLSFITTIFRGNTKQIKQSAKDTKNKIKEISDSTTNSSSQQQSTSTSATISQEETVGETTRYYEALNYFGGEKRTYFPQRYPDGRADSGHAQLKSSAIPSKKQSSETIYNPKGWHDYRFKYEDGSIKKANLMTKGHFIGYPLLDIDLDVDNMIPITHYLSVGTIKDNATDPDNPYSMLFYETALKNWLKEHEGYTLDYYAVANYTDDELIPRSVSLFWTGFDPNGKQVKIDLKDAGKATYKGITGSVTLLNVSKNAQINYATGEATPLIK